MKIKHYRWLSALFLLFVFAAAVHADTPLVSGKVVIEGDVTRYIYTVTNTLTTSKYICGFGDMILPDGTLSVGHSEPTGWGFWYDKAENTAWAEFFWDTYTYTRDLSIKPGESAVFEIYTSVPVVTQWITSWTVAIEPVEGRTYTYGDGTPLPVPAPVPEPSSILALLTGLTSLGGFALKRRTR
ncbi:MAG: PEP-CTERM sorting domain-containing protein [Armatimonadota bacterium]